MSQETVPDGWDEKIRLMIARTPHSRAIGMNVARTGPAEAWLTLPYQPIFIGDARSNVIHGGVITALLDHSCGAAVQLAGATKHAIATLDLRIDYMKPAKNGEPLNTHAHCYKLTRNIAFVRATAYQNGEDDLIANCVATFMLAANRSKVMGKQSPELIDRARELLVASAETIDTEPTGLEDVLDRSPYARFLGVEVDRSGDGIVSVLRYHPRLIGNPVLPALHGGAIGAFLETAAMIQVEAETGGGRSPKPIGLTVNYLRSGRPLDTFARAKITKEGRRVVAIAVEAWQEDPQKPIASAYGHFLLRSEHTEAAEEAGG